MENATLKGSVNHRPLSLEASDPPFDVTPQVTRPPAWQCSGGLAFGGRNPTSPAPFSDEEKTGGRKLW
jgi:hypothetical protein